MSTTCKCSVDTCLFIASSHSSLFETIQSNADSMAEQQAPYRDSPSAYDPSAVAHEEEGNGINTAEIMGLQQQEMANQDTQLDALSASIGRQHHLSLQMNDELETHAELLEDFDHAVDSTTARLGRASRKLDTVTRSLKEHGGCSFSLRVVRQLLIFNSPPQDPHGRSLVSLSCSCCSSPSSSEASRAGHLLYL